MKLKKIRISQKLLKTIFIESLRGKSLGRILMNHFLSQIELSGDTLDLGAGENKASYNRFLKYKKPFKITRSDFFKKEKNILKINLEKPFKLQDESFDNIMCFNVLEHIYNFQNVIKESFRVLKKRGIFIGSTPFMVNLHPCPHDYFRYSHEALLRVFKKEGFVCLKMVHLGFGPFTTAWSQWEDLLPKVFKLPFILGSVFLDVLIDKFSKYYRGKYPLSYIFVFTKKKS